MKHPTTHAAKATILASLATCALLVGHMTGAAMVMAIFGTISSIYAYLASRRAISQIQAAPSLPPPPAAPEDRLTEERAQRLLKLLKDSPSPLTISELLAKTRWTEEALLPGLSALVQSGRVDESLDVETGFWRYGAQIAFEFGTLDENPDARPISARLASTQSRSTH